MSEYTKPNIPQPANQRKQWTVMLILLLIVVLMDLIPMMLAPAGIHSPTMQAVVGVLVFIVLVIIGLKYSGGFLRPTKVATPGTQSSIVDEPSE